MADDEDDDEYETTKEDDDGNQICAICEETDEDEEYTECSECGREVCNDCLVQELENVDLCTECLAKCPDKVVEKEKIVEKPVMVEVTKEVVKVVGFSEPIL
jgi:hypothetical protein